MMAPKPASVTPAAKLPVVSRASMWSPTAVSEPADTASPTVPLNVTGP